MYIYPPPLSRISQSLSSLLSDISQVYVVCIHILPLYNVSPSSLSSPLSDISQVYVYISSPSFTYLPVLYPPLYQISLKTMYIYPPPLSRISQFSILPSIRYLSRLCIYILPLFHVSPSSLSSPLSDISQVYVVCIHILHLYKVSPRSLSSPLSDISQVYVYISSTSIKYLPGLYPPLYQISLKSMYIYISSPSITYRPVSILPSIRYLSSLCIYILPLFHVSPSSLSSPLSDISQDYVYISSPSITFLPVLYPPLYQISLKSMYIYPPPLSRISQFSILPSIRYLSNICIYILPLYHVSPRSLSSPLSDISQVYVYISSPSITYLPVSILPSIRYLSSLCIYISSPSFTYLPVSILPSIRYLSSLCIYILPLFHVSPSSLSSPLSDISQVYVYISSPSITYLPVSILPSIRYLSSLCIYILHLYKVSPSSLSSPLSDISQVYVYISSPSITYLPVSILPSIRYLSSLCIYILHLYKVSPRSLSSPLSDISQVYVYISSPSFTYLPVSILPSIRYLSSLCIYILPLFHVSPSLYPPLYQISLKSMYIYPPPL